MKRVVFILVAILVSMPTIGSFTKGLNPLLTSNNSFALKSATVEKSIILETVTVYNPTRRQCDKSPLVTASNARINKIKLYKNELRWIALSRHLLKRWKGDFNYGDTVRLESGDPSIDGLWIIQDNMNKRFKNCADLLFDSRVKRLGKWKNVKITKVTV